MYKDKLVGKVDFVINVSERILILFSLTVCLDSLRAFYEISSNNGLLLEIPSIDLKKTLGV